jgi:FAD/FMN-containing dehydrogenase
LTAGSDLGHGRDLTSTSVDDADESRARSAYGAEKYERLKKLKKKYDPDNFFRLNQNISPS